MERRGIRVTGIVQGVGFRPHVYQLAHRHGLTGIVRNEGGGVWIEVEGETTRLDQFCNALRSAPPPLSQIENLEFSSIPWRGDRLFSIESSREGMAEIQISPDVAPCSECLAEMRDPANRRYLYPFLNCVHCGPRFTIIEGSPYDREKTTMRRFPMCAECRKEFLDDVSRRFHAQPNACPACGPRLRCLDAQGNRVPGDPLAKAVERIQSGGIVAIQGAGGFHLACDAQGDTAVAELRKRKRRDQKPFAMMVSSIDRIPDHTRLTDAERRSLQSPARPIVLVAVNAESKISKSVAPGIAFHGFMLPSTPLHELILEKAGGGPLVMTSGNISDEPMLISEEAALKDLHGIADAFLVHDRPIANRCDDSIVRFAGSAEIIIRRSRGMAPRPLPGISAPGTLLAAGGDLKSVFALQAGSRVFLSAHLGDLEHPAVQDEWIRSVALFSGLFRVEPERVVCDLHPDYHSTRLAETFAAARDLPLERVQHHHAHMAGCLVDNEIDGPSLGLIWDGTGFGPDGAVWGGEFLVGDCRQVDRVGHFRYVAMPGSAAAIREPWRMAVSWLDAAGIAWNGEGRWSRHGDIRPLLQNKAVRLQTSSCGRLFDAVASLLGLCDVNAFEGQAALKLESAAGNRIGKPLPVELEESATGFQINFCPMFPRLLEPGRNVEQAAADFHATLARAAAMAADWARRERGISRVVLSGGVFQNARLLAEIKNKLGDAGFAVYCHRRTPANDAGLAFGQLAVAVSRAGS